MFYNLNTQLSLFYPLPLPQCPPKLPPGDWATAVSSSLRRGLKDANAAVVARCIDGHAVLAARLREKFAGGARAALPPLFERLREKRGPALAATTVVLRAFVRYRVMDAGELGDALGPLLRGGEPGGASSASSSSSSSSASSGGSSGECDSDSCVERVRISGRPVYVCGVNVFGRVCLAYAAVTVVSYLVIMSL